MYYYYYDNTLVNVESPQKVGNIEPTERDKNQDTKILAFDIETFKVPTGNGDSTMIAYACGFYDGIKSHIYYISDFISQREMLLACLKDMLKYDKHTVYCHNFSKFDINFIIKILVQEFVVDKIISKDLDILSIKVSYTFQPEKKGGKPVRNSITIADSCRLIPGSLEALAEAYGVITKKGKFPYNFVDKDNLEYVGCTPAYKYFIDPKKGAMITLFE
jgi:DNA polymerase elongation subunit (family B)